MRLGGAGLPDGSTRQNDMGTPDKLVCLSVGTPLNARVDEITRRPARYGYGNGVQRRALKGIRLAFRVRNCCFSEDSESIARRLIRQSGSTRLHAGRGTLSVADR